MTTFAWCWHWYALLKSWSNSSCPLQGHCKSVVGIKRVNFKVIDNINLLCAHTLINIHIEGSHCVHPCSVWKWNSAEFFLKKKQLKIVSFACKEENSDNLKIIGNLNAFSLLDRTHIRRWFLRIDLKVLPSPVFSSYLISSCGIHLIASNNVIFYCICVIKKSCFADQGTFSSY